MRLFSFMSKRRGFTAKTQKVKDQWLKAYQGIQAMREYTEAPVDTQGAA